MEFIIFYVFICYLFAFVACIHTKHMPFLMLIIAPISVPMTFSFIYAEALKKTFD